MAIYDVNGNVIGGGSADTPLFDVTEYGAIGNGTADDTTAIQSALNACHSAGGGTVFFPTGTYKLTNQLICYSNQIIELNGSTLLQGAQISNLLMGYCNTTIGAYDGCHDIIVQNGLFDGSTYTTENTLLGFIHSKDITVRNCAFINAYGRCHNIEICACYNVLFDNCIFEGARKNDGQGEMLQIDGHANAGTWPWANTGIIDYTPCSHIEVRSCLFVNGVIAPAIGNHATYSEASHNDNHIRIHDCKFIDITGDKPAISMQGGYDIDVYNNTFINCVNCVRQATSASHPTFVHDNRFESVTSPYPSWTGSGIIAYNNVVDGSLVA